MIFFSRAKQFIKAFFSLSVMAATSACTYQVSSLHSYNGPQYNESNKCIVARTALDSKFSTTINDFKDNIQGDSHVETEGTYENEEAAFDCMSVGAKTVLILDRGIISTNSTYISGSTYNTYNPSTNHYTTYSTPGYTVSSETSAYIIVFFNKKIPDLGNTITMDDYESWKKKNHISGCKGCE